MQKAFDTLELLNRAKARFPHLENMVETEIAELIEIISVWLEDSTKLTANPFDDLAVSALKAPVAQLKEAVKKIDIDGDGQ